MKTKEFIEKAIEGGYRHKNQNLSDWRNDYNFFEIILEPKAWEAVGKVEGWEKTYKNKKEWCQACLDGYDGECYSADGFCKTPLTKDWEMYMHRMTPHLILGKDLESYIETL